MSRFDGKWHGGGRSIAERDYIHGSCQRGRDRRSRPSSYRRWQTQAVEQHAWLPVLAPRLWMLRRSRLSPRWPTSPSGRRCTRRCRPGVLRSRTPAAPAAIMPRSRVTLSGSRAAHTRAAVEVHLSAIRARHRLQRHLHLSAYTHTSQPSGLYGLLWAGHPVVRRLHATSWQPRSQALAPRSSRFEI